MKSSDILIYDFVREDEVIITIDGPAGSGKSTAAKLLAKRLGYFHLDTGAIYRSITYICLKNGISTSDEDAVADIAKNINIEFVRNGESLRVIANDEDVTEKIRAPEVSMGASDIGKLRRVREELIDIQRRFARQNNIVAEGRDMGTVIFPEADVKFFLTASSEVRAKRRFLELKDKRTNVKFEDVLKDVERRDIQDMNRDVAPLKPAEDAIIVNTDNMNIEEVLEYLFRESTSRCKS